MQIFYHSIYGLNILLDRRYTSQNYNASVQNCNCHSEYCEIIIRHLISQCLNNNFKTMTWIHQIFHILGKFGTLLECTELQIMATCAKFDRNLCTYLVAEHF